MEISKKENGTSLSIAVIGRLDTTTAPQLDEEIKASLDGITDLEFDFAQLEYISSAGLRVILATQKVMSKQGKMTVVNVNNEVMEIFEITGFDSILDIRKAE